MKEITIGNIIIGEGGPVCVIAELACEHGSNMENAKRLIRAAKDAGVDIVKFQLHVPEAEMVPGSIKFWAGSMDDVLKKVNFEKVEEHRELKDYCDSIGIQYLCTPFCIEASDRLEKIGVAGYKIGSGELTNLPMLRHIAKKGKPMIVSTGMSTMEEIADAVGVLKEEGVPFMLMNCTSEYPAAYEHANLGLISVLKEKFGVMVGQSDHTTEIYTAVAAVALGAPVIEKHFTIRDLHGPDDIVSLDPDQTKILVDAVHKIEKTRGSERSISEKEKVVRDWAHHSVVAARDIKTGEKLTHEDLLPKRPGTGIPATYLDKSHSQELLGKRATRDLPKNTILHWSDVE